MASGDRKLPEKHRERFKEPLGRDIGESELKELDVKHNMLITVGDVVSFTVREYGLVPDLSVYDGMTERHEMTAFADLVKRKGLKETVVTNEAGMITAELADAVKNALTGHEELIRVEGEEDMAVIPCMMLAPDGTYIIYGWPGKGMKLITTDENIRREARLLIEMMEETE